MNNSILLDIERNPLAWKVECPKCGSSVNLKYALALSPILKTAILPQFYCPCTRFQEMELLPISLTFSRRILLTRVFLSNIFEAMARRVSRCQ